MIFDGSCYNQAGVERAMGFCTEDQVKRFLLMVPASERIVVEDGMILLKSRLEVSPEEQTKRLEVRIELPKRQHRGDKNLTTRSRSYPRSSKAN